MSLMATQTAMTTMTNPQKIQSAVLNPNIFFSITGKVEFFVLGGKAPFPSTPFEGLARLCHHTYFLVTGSQQIIDLV